jgi:pseudaminic acid biosynthesis-associated methylase
MSKRKLTDQEMFWRGQFGSEYTERNSEKESWDLLQTLSIEIRSVKRPISSVLELGANRGLNILALKQLLPSAEFSAVEINETAAEILKGTGANVVCQSLLDFKGSKKWDLVLIRGVLIHLNPGMLNLAYDVIAESSARYVLISEYYNSFPASVDYRGEKERLFKRDFAGEFMDQHSEFELQDYGFHYRKGAYFGDDQTWFLLEKKSIS